MADRRWASYVWPIGKHAGKTLGMIRIEDPTYIAWAAKELINNSECKRKAKQALEYLNEVDPWALEGKRTARRHT